MLVFTSKIPVKSEMTNEDFIELCTKWVYGSPHYHKLMMKYSIEKENYEINKENITCQFTHYEDQNAGVVAFRLRNEDGERRWTLDILFITQQGEKFISICSFHTLVKNEAKKV